MVALRVALTVFVLVALNGSSPGTVMNAGADGADRPAVLVNPKAANGGTARTIQEGIDMATPGGKVLVLPATNAERLIVTKGVTITAEDIREGIVAA